MSKFWVTTEWLAEHERTVMFNWKIVKASSLDEEEIKEVNLELDFVDSIEKTFNWFKLDISEVITK